MPLYEYKCQGCGKIFEVRQKFSDDPLTTHEGCGGAVERLLSPPALQFKGTGWYVTDYGRGNGKTARTGKTETAEPKTSSKSEPKADAKPAPASTTPAKT
jgi:putative FmdB family regulatory protein